jgi:hypothetical protein
VDIEEQLGKPTTDQLSNQKFEFSYYYWMQSSITHKYNLGNHKRDTFYPTPRHCSLLYTPIAYTKTTYQNLI